MSLTPVEVFEQQNRANSAPSGSGEPDFVRNAQRHKTYQGYNREGGYRNTAHQRPYDRPGTSRQQETSFTSAQRERNPGVRQRPRPPPQPPETANEYEHIRRQLESRGETRINIPYEPLTESTGLLSGATAGSSASGLSATAAGVGATGLAVGAGLATTAVVNRLKEKGAVLPGTDYVGPGNPINIDAPRHEADAIAKEHDVGYAEVSKEQKYEKFAASIRRLDEHARLQFAKDWEHAGRWQSLVGKYGLQAKNLIEDILGHPIYPSFTGKWGNLIIHHLINALTGVG
uniref:Structural protein n=1 Tax=Scindoambidensovirus sp. TaxID=2809839 RepID=A0AB74ULL9_9VIRU